MATLNIQCIRNSMAMKQECPICRKGTNEGQIRPMVGLEEVVESWKAARYVADCPEVHWQLISFPGH